MLSRLVLLRVTIKGSSTFQKERMELQEGGYCEVLVEDDK
jgi:hypothetical protein